MRLFKPSVRKMEEKKDVRGLLRALTDKDRVVCLKAAEAIESIFLEKLLRLGTSEARFISTVRGHNLFLHFLANPLRLLDFLLDARLNDFEIFTFCKSIVGISEEEFRLILQNRMSEEELRELIVSRAPSSVSASSSI